MTDAIAADLAPWAEDAGTELELEGFWRMFGGGGRCALRWHAADRRWHGTVADAPGSAPRHLPEQCRFSARRLEDFARFADCQRAGPQRWLLRYREPR